MYPKIIVHPNYFPTQWCDNINNWVTKNVPIDSRYGTKGVRRCSVRMLTKDMRPYDDVFRSMMEFVKPRLAKFDVDINNEIDGAIQHITYNPGDHVGWHNDLMDIRSASENPKYKNLKINRKLSMTVMLSDPSDYTGGEFIFDNSVKLPVKVEGKGTVALFTCHSQHKVEEVTSGVRNILFIFITGPEWR